MGGGSRHSWDSGIGSSWGSIGSMGYSWGSVGSVDSWGSNMGSLDSWGSVSHRSLGSKMLRPGSDHGRLVSCNM